MRNKKFDAVRMGSSRPPSISGFGVSGAAASSKITPPWTACQNYPASTLSRTTSKTAPSTILPHHLPPAYLNPPPASPSTVIATSIRDRHPSASISQPPSLWSAPDTSHPENRNQKINFQRPPPGQCRPKPLFPSASMTTSLSSK